MTAFQSRGWILAGLLIGVSAVLALGRRQCARCLSFLLARSISARAAVFLAAGVLSALGEASGCGRLLILLVVAHRADGDLLTRRGVAGVAGWGFWLKAVGLWIAAWMAVDAIARQRRHGKRPRPGMISRRPSCSACLSSFVLGMDRARLRHALPSMLPPPSPIGVAVGLRRHARRRLRPDLPANR